MPAVLTTASTVKCAKGGTVTLVSASPLRVDGAAVLVDSDVEGAPVDGCAPTASGEKPCTMVKGVSAGRASKLTVGGAPVLLDTLAGSTDGTVAKLVPALAGQSRLESA